MTKEQEFRKQTEEAKFEAFSFMCKKVTDLEKENAELKAIVRNTKAVDESFALQTMQLSKAKELLAKWVELFKPKGGNIPPTPIQVVTEQFLKGDGCPDCFCEDCTKDCDIDNAIQQANKGLDFDKIADEMEQDLKDSEVEK